MPLYFMRNDITQMHVDAIVTSANEGLRGGGGVDGSVHRAAGPRLLWECLRIRGCRTGSAVVTRAYDLPSRWVIHAVGPVWQGGGHGEERLLASCCQKALQLAVQKKCASVALPLISAGAYGYPKREAMQIISRTAAQFLETHDLNVFIVLFDRESVLIGEQLHHDIERYIDENYVRAHTDPDLEHRRAAFKAPSARPVQAPEPDVDLGPDLAAACLEELSFDDAESRPAAVEADWDLQQEFAPNLAPGAFAAGEPESAAGAFAAEPDSCAFDAEPEFADTSSAAAGGPALWDGHMPSLGDVVAMLDESFVQMLLRKIDEKGMKDSECYKRANIDRKHFSKMRSDIHYRPKKTTAIALAIALELPLEETNELLMKAGFALSRSSVADIIVEYFIRSGNYDIHALNQALFSFDQEPLC